MNISIELNQEEFKRYGADNAISYYQYSTPAGLLRVAATSHGIFKAEFYVQTGELPWFNPAEQQPLILLGTPFQIEVWKSLQTIPQGETKSYADIAHLVGKPSAVRAVANAIASNPIAYFIPCHRVVRSDGQLGGYAWGIEKKQQLLEHEKKNGAQLTYQEDKIVLKRMST